MREGAWKEGGYTCKRATGEILMVMELSCILTVVVDMQTYTFDKIP